MKHIYHLALLPSPRKGRYDIASDFVVVAGTEQEARKLAAREAGDEKPDAWLNRQFSTCEMIGEAFGETKIGVVCRSFHAG